MNFQLNDEQQQLTDSLKRLLDSQYDFESRKKIVASAEGYSPALWNTFAELGLLGLPLSEQAGGFGSPAAEMVGVMEALGEALVVEPFLATTCLAGRVLDRAGSEAQKQVLAGAVEGKTRLALAHQERGAGFELAVATSARRDGAGWVLDGEKVVVLGAPMADRLVVSARTSGKPGDTAGLSLFLVDAKAAGVSMKSYRTQDSMRAADVTLKGVKVGADALVGAEGGGFEPLDEALDFASAMLCAEAVGAMKFACETTLEYLKTRKQFGVTLGSFQALQHRLVDMNVATEQSRSITYLACAKVDTGDAAERRRTVAAARVKIADNARLVGQEAIQLHGGMGMTLEMKVSHTFKRLTMIGQSFGDADYYLARFAA
jgi:alkylation response protein AidB-like acyl-CoA dehydrogenase